MKPSRYTCLLVLLVPHVVALVAKGRSLSEVEAAKLFYSSRVYAVLEDELTKLWHFSPLTLYNMFEHEQLTGEIFFPEEG